MLAHTVSNLVELFEARVAQSGDRAFGLPAGEVDEGGIDWLGLGEGGRRKRRHDCDENDSFHGAILLAGCLPDNHQTAMFQRFYD